MSESIRCLISGRVQGVFFRLSTQQQAERLGVRGYVRNLPDGRVEVVACGEAALLAELRAWLSQGPPMARVSAVECTPVAEPLDTGFRLR